MRKGVQDCADALWADYSVAKEAYDNHTSLSVGWIDYSKAFDQVPQVLLAAVKVTKRVRKCIRKLYFQSQQTMGVKPKT